MEDYVKSELRTKIFERVGSGSVINAGIYETDWGKVFLKHSRQEEAKMYEGELESLNELSRTGTVRVPKVLLIGKKGGQCFLVTEYLDMKALSKYSSRLGTLLAQLHLSNIKKLLKKNTGFINREISGIDKFGFHVPTACGRILQSNEWCDDWVHFYTNQRLQEQVSFVLSKEGNRELNELWSHLQVRIPFFFKDLQIEPSLLHGDLWFGNVGETDFEPVVFDPASFYGHHEYDLAIAAMFYGFKGDFFDSYHTLIPKASGFKERHKLYLLFHHLNHWNHFGSHKESSLKIMRELVK